MTKYFSPLELLICVALISFLLSLFQPAYSKILENTSLTQCSQHYKRIGQEILLYSEDHFDYLPHEDGGASSPPTGAGWYQVIKSSYHERGLQLDQGFNIKMNSYLETESHPFRKISSIPTPTQTPLFFDSLYSQTFSKGYYTTANTHHGGSTMILFSDFHVKSYFAHFPNWENYYSLDWNPDF